MICDMIRPEGMSRPVGTAMQTMPGMDKICDMIHPEGMSRLVGTAMQTNPGTDYSPAFAFPSTEPSRLVEGIAKAGEWART